MVKLQKATISFVMSVCPSIHMEQLGSHWLDFHEIWYLSIFRKSVQKNQVSLNSNNNGYFTLKSNIHFWSYFAQFNLEWEMFQTKVVEKIKMHLIFKFFLKYIILVCNTIAFALQQWFHECYIICPLPFLLVFDGISKQCKTCLKCRMWMWPINKENLIIFCSCKITLCVCVCACICTCCNSYSTNILCCLRRVFCFQDDWGT